MMQIMVAAIALSFAAGGGVGFVTGYEVNADKLASCEASVELGNTVANNLLTSAVSQLKQNELIANEFNKKLEKAYAEKQKLTSSLSEQLTVALKRMHKIQRKNCGSSLPEADNSTISSETTRENQFSTGIIRLTERADEVENYAQRCWEFVNNNCNIAK